MGRETLQITLTMGILGYVSRIITEGISINILRTIKVSSSKSTIQVCISSDDALIVLNIFIDIFSVFVRET